MSIKNKLPIQPSSQSAQGKLTVQKAILLQFSVVFLSVFLLVAFMMGSIARINTTKNAVSDYNTEIDTLNAAGLAHYKWANMLMEHINTGDDFAGSLDHTACAFGQYIYADNSHSPEFIQSFIRTAEPIHMAIHAAGAEISALDIMEQLTYAQKSEIEAARMLAGMEGFEELSSQIDLQIADYERTLKSAMYVDSVEELLNTLMSNIDNTIATTSATIETAEAQLDAVISLSVVACLAVAVFTIAAILNALMYIKREIVDPVVLLEKGSVSLAEGDLSADFIIKSKTFEITALSISLDDSVKKLKYVISDIESKVGSMANKDFSVYPEMNYPGDFKAVEVSMANLIDIIRDTMSEIQSSATQVTTGSEQVSSGAQALAHGTMDQTSSVDELCHVVADVTQKVNETSQNAAEADKLGQVAVGVVEKSTEEMAQLMSAIEEIQTSSSYIEKIIHTIDDIAFQTNILALNAAVEAARAGVAGKGFAVVADEVRNLAQKSAEAAQNTTALIETSLRAVERGTELANSTNATFDEVVKNTEQVLSVVAEIATATQEQLISIDTISNSVGEISAVVQTNSATSEESAAASEELSSQANVMKSLISEFRLG